MISLHWEVLGQGTKAQVTLNEKLNIWNVRNDTFIPLIMSEAKVILFNLNHRIDSLRSLPSPDTIQIKELSKLNERIDSLATKLKPDSLNKVTRKESELQTKINAPIEKVEGAINNKLGAYSNNGATGLPGQINGQVNLPGVPGVDGAGDLSGNPDLGTGDVNIPGLSDQQLPDPEDINVKELGDKVEGVTEVTEKVKDVTEVTDKVNGYENDLQNIPKPDEAALSQEAENKIAQSDQYASLGDQLAEATAAQDKAKRYFDPMVSKEQTLDQAKEVAVNHFAGHEKELKDAMEQLSKLKEKFPDANGTLDLFKKTQDTYKQKHFYERLTPGLSLQIQKPNTFWLDVTPSLFCNITACWSAGLAWNERIAYNFKDKNWHAGDHIYGPRASVQFRLKPNLILRSDVEAMNAPVRNSLLGPAVDAAGRGWVWTYFAGIKHDFKFSNSLIGNVQVMYNLYNPNNLSPYVTRLNVRMGIELPLLKRDKKKHKLGDLERDKLISR